MLTQILSQNLLLMKKIPKKWIFIEDHDNFSQFQNKNQIQNFNNFNIFDSNNRFSSFRKSEVWKNDLYKIPKNELETAKSSLKRYNWKIGRNKMREINKIM